MFRGLIDDVKSAANEVVARIATRAAIGMVFVAAIGFAVAAITMQLIERFGGITASYILAGVFAVIGLIGIVAARVHDGREQERKAQEERAAEAEGPSAAEATTQAAAMQLPLALIGSLLSTSTSFISPMTLLRFIGRNAALVAFGGILAMLLWPQRTAADVVTPMTEPAE